MSYNGITLTPSAIKTVYECEPNKEFQNVVLQILTIKKVPTQNGHSERIRLVVSDGKHFMQAMLATHLNELVSQGKIEKHSIVRLTRFVSNEVSCKRILILLGLDCLTPDMHLPKIGNPETYSATTAAEPPAKEAAVPNSFQANTAKFTSSNINGYQNTFQNQQPAKQFKSEPGIFMIRDLNPYQNRWTIKARVLSKGEIKSWSNQKGEGRLFSCVFADESGEIRATGFKEAVNMFYELLVEGQVYTISKGQLKTANKKWSNVNNDYEMTLDTNTCITLCSDANIPAISYNATEIGQFGNLEPGTVVDVMAVVSDEGQFVEITSKAQKQLTKRDITLVDMSGWAVRCTLWGKQATSFEGNGNPVMAIKGCKISDYGGRSISVGFDSFMEMNPDTPQAHALRGWYDSDSRPPSFRSYNGDVGGGMSASGAPKYISDIVEENLGMGDKPDYFMLQGTISHIRQENFCYPGCPTCSKKITDMGGSWRCEKCDTSYDKPNYRYILSMSVSDYTGQTWIQSFNDTAEQVLGVTANELMELQEQDNTKFKEIFADALFKQFVFKIRAKAENYQDELKVRCATTAVSVVDYAESNKEMINVIEKYLR